MSQAQLAAALGKSVRTIIRWENGKTPVPAGVESQLEQLRAVPKEAPTPDYLTVDTYHLRPDLKLYARMSTLAKGIIEYPDKEHPSRLLGVSSPVPWGVLYSEAYLTALAAHRSGANKRTGDGLWAKIEATLPPELPSRAKSTNNDT